MWIKQDLLSSRLVSCGEKVMQTVAVQKKSSSCENEVWAGFNRGRRGSRLFYSGQGRPTQRKEWQCWILKSKEMLWARVGWDRNSPCRREHRWEAAGLGKCQILGMGHWGKEEKPGPQFYIPLFLLLPHSLTKVNQRGRDYLNVFLLEPNIPVVIQPKSSYIIRCQPLFFSQCFYVCG